MSGNRDERIRQKAHEIWEREGRPKGAAERHWQQAEGEMSSADGTARKPATRKPATAKTAKTEGASRKTVGAGPAIAKRSKDAKTPPKG